MAIVLLPFSLSGQSPRFRSLTQPADFQSQLLTQDAQGMIWVGGNQGLYQFDGLEWFPFSVPAFLSGIPVSSLDPGPDSTIWVGFETGWILNIQIGIQARIVWVDSVSSFPVSQIMETGNGQLWVATAGGGLWYRGLMEALWHKIVGLPDEYTYALVRDQQAAIWIATDRGIGILDPISHQIIEILDRRQGLPDEIVRTLVPVDSGIWIGTYEAGLSFYAYTDQQIHTVSAWQGGAINRLIPSAAGVWIGTDHQGIWLYSPQGNLAPIDPNQRYRIDDLLLDREGNLWSCGQPFGLRLGLAAFQHYSVPGGSIYSLHCGKTQIWFATDSGVFSFKAPDRIEKLSIPVEGKISCLYEDPLSYLWIGTQGHGVWRLAPNRREWQHLTEADGLVSDHILSISGDQQNIWFATFGGAARCALSRQLGPEVFELFNQSDGLGVNYIYQAFIDSRERVWFGTDGKGLRYFENGDIKELPKARSATFLSIDQAPGGNVWFHSPEEGLFYWEGGELQGVDWKPQGEISNILADRYGRILTLGTKGLDLYLPGSGEKWSFDAAAGYPGVGPDLHLAGRDGQGKIWIGTESGLLCFQDDMLPVNRRPKALLNGVSVFLQRQNSPSGTAYSHDQNHLSFSYSGLWYQAPEAVQYQYRLQGLDLDWVGSFNRELIYPRLGPGTYQLELRAGTEGAFQRSPIIRYSFSIQRPFWQRWWFPVGLGMLLTLLGYIWVKRREERLRNTERLESAYLTAQFETLKNQINPHFLFNSFNTLAAIIENQPKEAVAYVEHLSDLFRNILDFREESAITVGQEMDLLRKFYFLQKFRFGTSFRLIMQVPEAVRQRGIPPLTLQMLVENALKHNIVSRKQVLEVFVEVNEPGYLTVRNTLQLRRDQRHSTHIGHQNIRQRYQLLGAREVKIEISQSFYSVHIPLLPNP